MEFKHQTPRNAICTPCQVHTCRGFNLVELLISISIAAIVLVLAMPSLRSISANNQVIAVNNSIVTGLNMARASAITGGRNISICPSSDGVSCAANNWHQGWIVFNDANTDGAAAAGEIIRIMSTQSGATQSGYGGAVVFLADGTTNLGGEQTITSCFADSYGSDSCLDVVVSVFGKIKSAEPEEEETE